MDFALQKQPQNKQALDALENNAMIRKGKLSNNHEPRGETLNVMDFVDAKRGEFDISAFCEIICELERSMETT